MKPLHLSLLLLLAAAPAYAQTPALRVDDAAGDSLLTLDTDGGLLLPGTFGTGSIPAEGAGTRLMWYPAKAAFRAGRLNAFGGYWNDATIGNHSVAFGVDNLASGDGSFASGGGSRATGKYSVAFGGSVASGIGAIAAGTGSDATGEFSVALGISADAQGKRSGALGSEVAATQDYAFAFGTLAQALHVGAFALGDASTQLSGDGLEVTSTADHQFSARFSGGYRLYTSTNTNHDEGIFGTITGVSLAAGGTSWETISDRRRKEHLLPVDGEAYLRGLRALPLTTWNYRGQSPERRHVGPMAQDFHAAFGRDALGTIGTDTTLATQDVDGVLLVAAQALEARTASLTKENAALRAELDALREEVRAHHLPARAAGLGLLAVVLLGAGLALVRNLRGSR